MTSKTKWSYLAAMAFLTEHPVGGVTTYVYCENETDYRNQCRKLIPDHEINWQPTVDGVLRTEIVASQYEIVLLCTVKKEPIKPPSILAAV